MMRLRLILLCCCFAIVCTAVPPASAQGNIEWEELWKQIPPRGHTHLPMSWMNDSLAFTGMAYDQTRDVIYVVSPRYYRSGGMLIAEPRVFILDADSGKLRMDLGRSAYPGKLGQGGELPVPLDTIAFGHPLGFARNRFALYKIDVDEEGRIYACNLVNPIWDYCKTSGPAITGCDPDYEQQGPFRVWRWDAPDATPELIYATLNTNGDAVGDQNSSEMGYSRWGDAFAVTGKRSWYYPPGPAQPVLHDSVRIYVSGGAWPAHQENNTVAVIVEDRRPYAQRPDRDTHGGGKLSFRLAVNLVQPTPGAASHGIAPERDTLFHGHFTREIWMSGNIHPVTRSTELVSSIAPIPQTYQPNPQNILSLAQSLTGMAGPLDAFELPQFGQRYLVVADGYPTNIGNPQLPNTATTARVIGVTTAGAEYRVWGSTPRLDDRILETIDNNNYVADVDFKIQSYPGNINCFHLFVLMSNNGIASYRTRSCWDPVELSAFTANWLESHVLIRWHVESETNALLFRVERSEERDGLWQPVGTMPARGTTTVPAWYELRDENPPVTATGGLWYRLVEIDTDGTESAFPAVRVSTGTQPEAFALHVFPQPLRAGTQQLRIALQQNETGKAEFTLRDVLGRRIGDPLRMDLLSGASVQTLPVGELRSGTYLLTVRLGDGRSLTRRIVVQ
ncbi:MAG: hypothetical protein C0600_13525 [Ignavibacteria bacterium]|nr:MAG: hypothetical protein C0600_13525 [Ignavibacteria bacterium]